MMHKLVFDDTDMAVIERALAELPFRLAMPLITKINQQLAEGSNQPIEEKNVSHEHMRHGVQDD